MFDASSLSTYRADGCLLHFAQRGDGPPLLLIHGSLCDARYWRPQMIPLAEAAQVLAPCLRYCWPESGADDAAGFSISRHATDLAILLERCGSGPAHVLGHSRGARVALELARHHPEHVRSLILADPGPIADSARAVNDDFRLRAMRLIDKGDVETGLELFIDTVSGKDTWRQMVPWFKTMVRDNAHTLIPQSSEAIPVLDDAALGKLAMPTLLLGGDQSPAPFPAALVRLQQTMPDTRHVRIPHASHGMNLANPRAFNATVQAFIGSVDH